MSHANKVLWNAPHTGWYWGSYAGRTSLFDRTKMGKFNCADAICDRTQGVFKLVQINKIQLEKTLMATVKDCKKKVQLYKPDELLGAVPNGVATLSIESQGKSAIVDKAESSDKVDVNIIIIANQHALSLTDFNHWKGNWGSNPIDRFLRRKITWISINNDATIKKGGVFDSFKKLNDLAKKDSEMVAKLKRTDVFLNLSQYLSTNLTEN